MGMKMTSSKYKPLKGEESKNIIIIYIYIYSFSK